ncbi:headcase protein homolog isoform X1 [Terrapene carolina triunguis]|uniref:Hdc homolog, cell cycle regulator n=1 Tax=Terrapene triunguis TaxID=2587831 RepID=A0A674HVZ5_9SAUR|nr:headcase protein homolog isoform X1 [Terrapene carolina triunguis]
MPNQKSSKGKKNKRANSSGDEQENGALALAAAAGAAMGAAAAAAGAAGGSGGAAAAAATAGGGGGGGAVAAAGAAPSDSKSEAPCATPLICSFGRPVDLEKDDYQKVVCNNEHCPYSTWMHLQCFYEWESSILVQFNCIGRARSWNEKQCRQNMWTKKGYDLAFRFCSCRCGQGHLKKDTDWYQVKRMQDEKKKKSVSEKSTGRSMAESVEDAKKCRPVSKPQKGLNHDIQRRHSMDRQNSQEKGIVSGSYAIRSPCGSPGQSPPTGYSILAPAHFSGPRSSRYLGEFLKNAIHLEPHKKNMTGGGMFRNAHFDYGASGLQVHRSGHFDAPVQFLRRLDLSELLTHIPRHKLNTFHVRMEDDAQVGQGEDLRKFILAALSASHRNVVNCALCHRALPVFEQFPLVDGTLFLSPSRHDEIEYDVPCHLQGRLMHLYAVCVDCLEGVHKIICIKCKSRWDGSWHQLGTMYTYDILAASPCCQARLNCKHCGKPVIDVRIGMQYFSEYSNVQQCPHCGNLDYHFVKPFSSFKVLEAY